MGELLCPRCKLWKLADLHFYWNKSTMSYTSYCKDCHKAATVESRKRTAAARAAHANALAHQLVQENLRIRLQKPMGPPTGDELFDSDGDPVPMADWVTDEDIEAALGAYDSGVVKDLDEGAP
jgi:hypothetical protein